jgi:ATP-binding cassette, subfamily B, bacterial
MVALGTAAAAGDLTLTEFALAAQATVAVLLLGEHYPESDVQTQLGTMAAVGIRRFEHLVGAAEPPAANRNPAAVPIAAAQVRFRHVSFRYPGGERTVLDGLDLELTAGECTAVVGLNGAGKTTLVKLLARLYEPTAGSIAVDGVDIRTLPVGRWRRQLSVVFQDFVRYELSAADNIAFGAVHAPRDPDAIRQVAASAGILHRFERLPRGLDTPLARSYVDGIDLSGGEWQRLAIARCLYAIRMGARVVVLDEPTAALDPLAEARFFDRFVDLTQGATGLLISHRFSSVRRAHRIVVIDGGRVVEQGSHEQLLAREGRYASLFRLQAARFTAAATKDRR